MVQRARQPALGTLVIFEGIDARTELPQMDIEPEIEDMPRNEIDKSAGFTLI